MPLYPPTSGGGGHVIEEEATPLNQRANLNFTGAGVSAADVGGKTVITINGGAGSFAVSETEVDFGSTPVTAKEFTVTDAAIVATNEIMCLPSGNPATSRVGNDFSWEVFSFSALAGTGQFTLSAVCANGSVVGKRKVLYVYS